MRRLVRETVRLKGFQQCFLEVLPSLCNVGVLYTSSVSSSPLIAKFGSWRKEFFFGWTQSYKENFESNIVL